VLVIILETTVIHMTPVLPAWNYSMCTFIHWPIFIQVITAQTWAPSKYFRVSLYQFINHSHQHVYHILTLLF
jgi:hypothetical protein